MSNIGEDLEKLGESLVSQLTRTNDYIVIDEDLTIIRARPTPVAPRQDGLKYRSFITLRVDAAVTLRFNAPTKPGIPLPAGILLNIDDHDFEEVFLSNVAGAAGTRFVALVTFNRRESQAVR